MFRAGACAVLVYMQLLDAPAQFAGGCGASERFWAGVLSRQTPTLDAACASGSRNAVKANASSCKHSHLHRCIAMGGLAAQAPRHGLHRRWATSGAGPPAPCHRGGFLLDPHAWPGVTNALPLRRRPCGAAAHAQRPPSKVGFCCRLSAVACRFRGVLGTRGATVPRLVQSTRSVQACC